MNQKTNTFLLILTLTVALINSRTIEVIETRTDVIYDELIYISSLTVEQKRELERLILSKND